MRGIRNEPIALARVVSLALLTLSAWGLAAASAHAQERGPLVLAKASYFFVGGKIDTSLEGSPMVGHMYVESMIPQRQRHPYPIVMVHGGSQTGTNFTGTPDGREGWAQYFVRRGYAVHVVDQVARGRSAHWSQVHGPVQSPRFNFAEQRFIAPERLNLGRKRSFIRNGRDSTLPVIRCLTSFTPSRTIRPSRVFHGSRN